MKKIIDTIRNTLFDIYPEQFVLVKASFRAEKLFTDALWSNNPIEDPEEMQRLAQIETEKFYHKSITAFLLKITGMGTAQKIQETYRTHFVNGLNLMAKRAIQTRQEMGQPKM